MEFAWGAQPGGPFDGSTGLPPGFPGATGGPPFPQAIPGLPGLPGGEFDLFEIKVIHFYTKIRLITHCLNLTNQKTGF